MFGEVTEAGIWYLRVTFGQRGATREVVGILWRNVLSLEGSSRQTGVQAQKREIPQHLCRPVDTKHGEVSYRPAWACRADTLGCLPTQGHLHNQLTQWCKFTQQKLHGVLSPTPRVI